ncbi:ABC transporter permease [Mucilaginibacter calamicampi]|uniref:Transport permease protein n=1 Tax=Mucilaginibacter calamicampi TaxID=1302352 RepID=A0ABW2YWB8_9SPHI
MQKSDGSTNWTLKITSSRSAFDLHLKDIWLYRDLLWLIVRRDFVSFYKQTILGPLWFFIQPIFTTVIYVVVFSNLAKISTSGAPPAIFYLVGTVAWTYFSDCLTKTSTVFRDNVSIFGKVYFPRLIMPLSIIFSNLIKFGVQFLLFLILLIYYVVQQRVHINNYVLLFPVVILLMAILGLGIGLIITALTTKYRDLAFIVTFGMQLLMYATPVIYPLSAAPAKYRTIISLNPMSGLIETFRYGFLGTGDFYPSAFLYSIFASIVLLILGLIVFNKVEKNFVDKI